MAVTDPAKMMQVARVSMLFHQPFFGHLALKLKLTQVSDVQKTMGFKTAAVDGRNMYYNPDFITALSKEERIFLVAHEVMHCVLSHIGRRFDRDPQIWNMANDYVINAMLVESGLKMPKIGLYEEKYAGWSSEEVYDDLIENNTQPPKESLDHHMGDPECEGLGDNSEGGKDGEEGKSRGKNGQMTEQEKKELEDFWKDNIAQAAASVGAGNLPAGVKRLIDDFLEPKMDWRQQIQVHLQSAVRSDYTWMKPNKRTFGAGITLPSMDLDDHVTVAVAVDTSGSVSPDQLRDFLSEVKGVMDQFSGYTIHIACFDTQVYNPQTFTNEDDLMSYELQGFGGTDFMCWWNWLVDNGQNHQDIPPPDFDIADLDKILFFTDGYPYGDWGIDNVADTIWVVHGGTDEGPFGHTVFYEDIKQ